MYKIINNTMINFMDYDEGMPIVFIPGYDQNISDMDDLGLMFENCRIVIVDLPGIGESDDPSKIYSLDDYTNILRKLLLEIYVENPIIIGSGIGGKVAIKYASKYEVEKLVLIGISNIKKENSSFIKEFIHNKTKNIALTNKIREYALSRLYKDKSPIMRKTILNINNEALLDDIDNINIPTLLMWGNKDKESPLEVGKELEAYMNNATLVEFDGTNKTIFDNKNQIYGLLKEFFRNNKTRKKIK